MFKFFFIAMPKENTYPTKGSRLALYALPHQVSIQTAFTVLLAVIYHLLFLLELALHSALFIVTRAVSVVLSATSTIHHTIDLHYLQQIRTEPFGDTLAPAFDTLTPVLATSPLISSPTNSCSLLIPLTICTPSSTPLLFHTIPTTCAGASLGASEDDLDGILVYSFLGDPSFPNTDDEHGLKLESLDLSLPEIDDIEHELVTGVGGSVSPVSIATTPTTMYHILPPPPSDSPLSKGAATDTSIGSFADVFDNLLSVFKQSIITDSDGFTSEGEIHPELSWYCVLLSDSMTWYTVTIRCHINIPNNWADACPVAQHIHRNVTPQISQ
ncbi:hypothetical protein FIBSPDRAFT_886882 [Athelia psychrophila]|uniref:Uncharacterized protein n=1 Tax=Athelia psychrophila TaxID=1759441 RepID=A0A166QBX5_9AGAM|nr:hypothetical protein FIBSPDRAFT_886882 [Fibularhizoctonia sp. CBS 109695]